MAARRLGVDAASTVIVYDGVGLFSAPRVWWNFRAMGHTAVAVLSMADFRGELSGGRAIESGWKEPPHGDFRSHPDERLVRTLDQE